MRKVMHLSDLHFGRTDPTVVMALRQIARRLDPDLIVVSGDLTQRARIREFVAARAFLDSLAAPALVVPGNHDVPLYNIAARFLAPLKRYRRLLASEVEPAFVDDEMAVVGINTARSLTFKGGRINHDQVQRAIALFCGTSNARIRILVTHHPFDLPGIREATNLVGRAAMAMSTLGECMPDLLLAGHLHLHATGTTVERYDLNGHSAIVVQAGTATSTRVRGARNSFNLLHVDRSRIAVDRFDWSSSGKDFNLHSTCRFVRREGEWRRADAAGA
ncbi:MAG: metallophosphoesterase [Casimicrobiaceae bacterium]